MHTATCQLLPQACELGKLSRDKAVDVLIVTQEKFKVEVEVNQLVMPFFKLRVCQPFSTTAIAAMSTWPLSVLVFHVWMMRRGMPADFVRL